MKYRILASLVIAALLAPPTLFAQSAASNKTFFSGGYQGVTFAPVSGAGYSAPVTLYSIEQSIKTSSGGGLSAILSMEAALWTYNLTTAIVNGGKSSSSSRAAIKAWIEVDGVPMHPGEVVFTDRLQATGVTLNLTCQSGTTCTVAGDLTLELFQRTKGAASFVFYSGPLPPVIHTIEVKAQALIECRSNGTVIPCPQATLDGYTDAMTQAAIGKSSLLVEEQQNWGAQ